MDHKNLATYVPNRHADSWSSRRVFRDVQVDFRDHIATQLESCEFFLAVIGRDWLELKGEHAIRRIDHPADHVRLETQVALGKGVPVIPVLVRGARMPTESELPDTLKDSSYRNAISVRPDPDFHRDMDRLVSQIKG